MKSRVLRRTKSARKRVVKSVTKRSPTKQAIQKRVVKSASKYRQAERPIRQDEGRFRTLIEHSTDAISLVSPEGTILYANPTATRVLGYSMDELMGRSALRDLHPDDLPKARDLLSELLEKPNLSLRAEFRYLRKDGTWIWLEGIGTNLLTEPGVHAIVANFRDITQRRRTETELRQSRDQLEVILRGVAQGITVQAPDGKLIYANQAAARITGFGSAEELLQTPVDRVLERFEVMDESGNPFLLTQLPGRIALQGRQPSEQVLRFRIKATGEEHWSIVNASPILDEHGQVELAVNIFRDITELRRAQEVMAEQREYWRVTLASIGDAVIATDRQGHVTLMNSVAETLTGWRSSEAAGRPLHEVFQILNEQTLAPVENPFTRVMREGMVVGLGNHTVLITREGRQVPIEDSAAPIRDARDNTNGVVLVFRDATERRRAEAAIGRLAAIVESSQDAIIGKTLDAIITSWNQSAERLFGYTAEQAIGKSISILVPPDRPDELPSIMERLKRGERVERFETERVTKDGRRIPVEVSISPVIDERGAIIGASDLTHDISKRKREEANQRFLAAANYVLATSLDYEATLERVAQFAVPEFADWCVVHIVQPDGTSTQIALAHKDPAKRQWAYELQQNYPPRDDSSSGVHNVLRTGKSEMVSDVPDALLVTAARDEEHLSLLRQVGIKSYMVVPLIARDRTLGTISFISGESNRRFTEQDLAFAEILAGRAAIAIDNARLHHETRKLNEDLEHRVVDRTIDLMAANERLEDEIAERQRAQLELQATYGRVRALASRLQTVREEERTRIARELHDELGQALTALKFDLSSLAGRLPKRNETLRAEAQAMSNQIDATIKMVRRISTELRPGMLDDLGLAAAIEWQGQEFAARTGIECQVTLPDHDFVSSRAQATAIFRIFQETLTNVARHAEATKVDVKLESVGDTTRLQVRDNGRGFDNAGVKAKHSLGLLGMEERAEILGGSFEVESAVGQGTTVTVVIPLEGAPTLEAG